MHGTYLIEVVHKAGVTDPLARRLEADLRQNRMRGIQRVETSQLYRLIGELTPAEQQRIAKDLLSDPVIQQAQDGLRVSKGLVIDVWYKEGVTDVVGESVLKGVRDLGIQGISAVRTAMRYRFYGTQKAAAVEKLVQLIGINPLVHDRTIYAG